MSQDILQELIEGNKRFASETSEFPRLDKKRRLEGLNGQSPKAIIIGCADSRVPPELIFDQGLGDLFVLRVAGNIIDDAIIGSVEYAVAHLGSPLIMVLSHQNCGAIGAAIETAAEDAPGSIGSLVEAIQPAIENVRGLEGDFQDNATRENARLVAESLKTEGTIIKEAYADKKVDIVAAYYDFETGIVSIL